jgi:predicted dehydrogenase
MKDQEKSMKQTNRREFLSRAAGALAVSGAPLAAKDKKKTAAAPKRRILGANDRINVAFVGTGMRFTGLMRRDFGPRKEAKNDVEFVAACDVWEPRLKYAQEMTKAPDTYRDYREIIQRPDVDGVVIAVPDHWHYAIAKEACLAGKDVYLEKPMTHTVEEAAKLNDDVLQTGCVLQVGGSGPNMQLLWKANEYIRSGKMGKTLWGLISYNRNSAREGEWDYPIPGIGDKAWPDAEVSPNNLDWNTWLGPARKRPFSPERYFRWRKYWEYSGGNATDLLYHRLGMMSTMIGFDFPTRVVGAGGIYVQKDREVPDTYMTMIEYPGEYSVNMISCMGNSQSVPITVYGNWATLQIVEPDRPSRLGNTRAVVKAERAFLNQFKEANDGKTEVEIQTEEGPGLADNWLDCIRTRTKPVYDVLRGYQVMVAIKLGVESYRTGKVMAFDPVGRSVLRDSPAHKEYVPKEA